MDAPQLLNRLARSLAKDTGRPWAMRLCEACVDAVGARGGAVTVSIDPDKRAAVSTPGAFEELEPLQEILGEGPVHQAMAGAQLVVTRLGTVVDEYPVFSQLAAATQGEATLYAAPMRAGARVVGVLSLYVTAHPQGRSTQDLQVLADVAAASLMANVKTAGLVKAKIAPSSSRNGHRPTRDRPR